MILNLCVRLIIWGLADMVRAGLRAIHFSTPFQGVKTSFSGGKHGKITFYTTDPIPVILKSLTQYAMTQRPSDDIYKLFKVYSSPIIEIFLIF